MGEKRIFWGKRKTIIEYDKILSAEYSGPLNTAIALLEHSRTGPRDTDPPSIHPGPIGQPSALKASDYIIQYLHHRKVTHIFEVIGGMTTHLVDSAYRLGKIQLVSTHHEQAAAFAAGAMGSITGIPGIAMATSGPGAVNLLTGIGSCYFDSIPAIFITGQVNISEQKKDRPIRQLGFQETDIVGMAGPITKAAWNVQSADQIPSLLQDAFRLACSGRPGPVLLDIPMDVQSADLNVEGVLSMNRPPEDLEGEKDYPILEEIFSALNRAGKPLILAGGGIRSARMAPQFRELVDRLNVPVVHSLMAVDALPSRHPLRAGLIGTYGNRWANHLLGESDVILVLGSRLDIRQTGADVEAFKDGKTIYHVDCDQSEINNRVRGCRPVPADLRRFLPSAIEAAKDVKFESHTSWVEEIGRLRNTWPDTDEISGIPGINPNRFMHELSRASAASPVFCVDVGNHQMWAAQSLEIGPGQQFITSGGMGAMGFSLPAAIGAGFALPGASIVQVTGDGGMQINIQELQTIVHHRLPIKMVVINNRSYGMVRQFQQSYFQENYPSTMWGYSAPDFVRVAEAYGIRAMNIQKEEEVPAGLSALWMSPREPFLLQVDIDPRANAYPKIAFGHPLTHMEPLVKPKRMEGA